MKDYLLAENQRNHRNHDLFTRLLKRAVDGCEVTIGHHVSFQTAGEELNEIPSADTVIFDIDLMSKVFGSHAVPIMQHLAVQRVDSRDALLEEYLNALDLEESGVKADTSHV